MERKTQTSFQCTNTQG